VTHYRLPLNLRRRLARNKNERYARDPEFRLACINASRARRGAPPITSLAEMGNPRGGRRDAPRDERGRFA
jgi:hypothetical protein